MRSGGEKSLSSLFFFFFCFPFSWLFSKTKQISRNDDGRDDSTRIQRMKRIFTDF